MTELNVRLDAAAPGKEKTMPDHKEALVIGGTIKISRSDLVQLARHYHLRRLALFGSAARRERRAGSDIDLLVEFEPGKAPSLGGLVEIQESFGRLFGDRKVDVATPSILNNPYRRRAIEKDLEELYAT